MNDPMSPDAPQHDHHDTSVTSTVAGTDLPENSRARRRTDGSLTNSSVLGVVDNAANSEQDAAPSSLPPPTVRSRSYPVATSMSANPARAWQARDFTIDRSSLQAAGEGQHPAGARPEIANMDGALPDDDGMQALRQKLHEIRLLAVSAEEKAQRMHHLMTQDYTARRVREQRDEGESSNTTSPVATSEPLVGAAAEAPSSKANPYNIQPGDLEPQVSPLAFSSPGNHNTDETAIDDGIPSVLGCMHYKRNVKLQCFDCQRWFPCRHCHDAALDLPFPHTLNRKKTENMLCMLCFTPQPAAEVCAKCGEYAAWYYCSKCKLWDNDSNKRIYHCDDCGICRVGEGLGKDYVHCRRCNVCISIARSPSHPCIERATEGDCPLCLVRLFESKGPVVSLPCGHYMHGDCYRDLMAVTYKCPVCHKSAVNMELQWRKLDDEIRAQPMPDDDNDLEGLLPLASEPPASEDENQVASSNEPRPANAARRPRSAWVGCNDCSAHCWTPFHWLGLKCQACDSYNTVQLPPRAFAETDAERVLRQQRQHHRQHDFTGDNVLRDAGIVAPGPNDVTLLEVPSSPAQMPTNATLQPNGSPRSTGSPHSPGRYFVREHAPRRPSYGAVGRFTAPSLPTIPNLPSLPESLSRMPRMPNLPNLPNMPNMPTMPTMPAMPTMPNIDFPRFSPYDMFSAVSRSLSPMAYYLQGLEASDGTRLGRRASALEPDLRFPVQPRDRDVSPASVRSEPVVSSTVLDAASPPNQYRTAAHWHGKPPTSDVNLVETNLVLRGGHRLRSPRHKDRDPEHVGDESGSGSDVDDDRSDASEDDDDDDDAYDDEDDDADDDDELYQDDWELLGHP